jgi:hypothetical protein
MIILRRHQLLYIQSGVFRDNENTEQLYIGVIFSWYRHTIAK